MKKIRLFTVLISIVLLGFFAARYLIPPGNPSKLTIPELTNKRLEEGLAPGKYIDAYVKRVIDGDTIEINYKGKDYKARLLDIDTPESVKSGVAVQAYGKEASEYTRKMVQNKTVKLVFEKKLKDRYGRLLAHIILNNGNYLNALLVRNGYARVEIVSPNKLLSKYFDNLLKEAVKSKVGMWGLPEKKRPFIQQKGGYYVPKYWAK